MSKCRAWAASSCKLSCLPRGATCRSFSSQPSPLERRARGETGCIHLGFAGATCFQSLVPGIISAHRERYPSVLVSPEERNTPLLVAGLRSGEIDIAFIRPPLSDDEGLEVEPLVEEPMVIVLPESHPRAGDRSMPLAPLAEETLILFRARSDPACTMRSSQLSASRIQSCAAIDRGDPPCRRRLYTHWR
jgi:DNA-binding transcriptional LysR family regulator